MLEELLEELANCLYCWEAVEACQQYKKNKGLDIQFKAYGEYALELSWSDGNATYYF